MYCDFFGLQQKPFSLTPNPQFLFLSRQHRDVLAHLLYGLKSRCGFIGISGEVGTGKTTLLRSLLQEIDTDDYRIALIFNPFLSSHELLSAINREFDLPSSLRSNEELLNQLNHFLLEESMAGRIVVLIIDEAQNLAPEVLEQIRLISNLETNAEKLLQIALVGQPELDQLLQRKDLRQLNQRIAVRSKLNPMTREDTTRYIRHRLQVAGGESAAGLFSSPALKMVFRHSEGIPRLINLICDRALLIAFGREQRYVDARSVRTAVVELDKTLKSSRVFRLPGASLWEWLREAAFRRQMNKCKPVQYVSADRPMIDQEASASERVAADPDTLNGPEEFNRQALNALARRWKIPSAVSSAPLMTDDDIVREAKSMGLQVIPFCGDLTLLAHLQCPALLKMDDDPENQRFLAFDGMSGEQVRISPGWNGRKRLERQELEADWHGHGLLLWNGTTWLSSGENDHLSPRDIYRLQHLLITTGWMKGSASGRFDESTKQALKVFQCASDLPPDGRLGAKTLSRLQAEANRFGFCLKKESRNENHEQYS